MSGSMGCCRGQTEDFRKALGQLQERCDVLHDVLLASGLMKPQEMETRLHRRRFDAARRAHPCIRKESLSDTIANTSVAFHAEAYMHLSTIHMVRSVSQAFRSKFTNRTQAVDRGKLYWWSHAEPNGPTTQLWESYDFTSSTWDTLPCPSNLQQTRRVVGGFGSLYLCGQFCLWHRYDIALKEWYPLPPMPSGRPDCDAAFMQVVGGKLYVSGVALSRVAVAGIERFDPRENVWEVLPRFRCLRVQFAWSVVSGKLYVTGGHIQDTFGLTNLLECYDAEANVWDKLPGTSECSGACAGIGLEGCLYIIGGSRATDESICGRDNAECYCPRMQKWTDLPRMREQRQSPSLDTSRGCLYVSSTGTSIERFDPALGSWEEVRFDHALSAWEAGERRAPVDYLRSSMIFGSVHAFVVPLWEDYRRIARFNSATGRWEDIAIKKGLGAFTINSC
eukprot:TRINITY_DN28705_c0_g3_i1.p1 TRINITY_DN28705_c0_g3~~TRINITY_DN28705_c0_g3_i1.p1  ORF type:complete len:449 (+),score=31.54 TRINITY_DN28705_c0_g3_i1:62-1408(+)